MGKILVGKYFNLGIPTKWYVIANRTTVSIYKNDNGDLALVKKWTHPEGRLTERELDSDKPGTGLSSGFSRGTRHSLDRRSKQHEQAAKRFAHEIGETINDAKKRDYFQELILVAEPHFLGLLRGALSTAVRRTVTQEIRHEYFQDSPHALKEKVLQAAHSF